MLSNFPTLINQRASFKEAFSLCSIFQVHFQSLQTNSTRFPPYGGRLSLTLAVALGGIPVWRQQSCTPFAYPLKTPPDCHLKREKKIMQASLRQLSDCQHGFSSSISLPFVGCVASQSPMVGTGSAVFALLTAWLCTVSEIIDHFNLLASAFMWLLEEVTRTHLTSDGSNLFPLM